MNSFKYSVQRENKFHWKLYFGLIFYSESDDITPELKQLYNEGCAPKALPLRAEPMPPTIDTSSDKSRKKHKRKTRHSSSSSLSEDEKRRHRKHKKSSKKHKHHKDGKDKKRSSWTNVLSSFVMNAY